MKRRGGEKEGGDKKEGRERDETGKDDRREILTQTLFNTPSDVEHYGNLAFYFWGGGGLG